MLYLDEPDVRLRLGDSLEVLKKMESGFLRCRGYLTPVPGCTTGVPVT